MSQSARDLGLLGKLSSKKSYEIPELYGISRGKREDWGIDGYTVPKTTQYIDRVSKFPMEKRPDAMSMAMKRSKEPDPAKYSPDLQSTLKKNWLGSGGKFLTGKKSTIIDQVMAQAKTLPGPGDYFKEGKKEPHKENFSTVEALSNEIPPPWKYEPYKETVKKNSNWSKSKDSTKKLTQILGPGYYETVVKAKNLTLPNSKKYSFPKARSPDAISLTAYYTRNVPGVGKYSEAYNTNSLASLVKNSNKKIIRPYKTKRYLEEVIKLGSTVPGPGAYDIGPPKSKKEKTLE